MPRRPMAVWGRGIADIAHVRCSRPASRAAESGCVRRAGWARAALDAPCVYACTKVKSPMLQAAVAGHGEPRWPRPDLRAGHSCESEKTWDGFLAPPPTHAKPSQPRCRLVCKRLQTWRLLAPARPNCGDGPFPLHSRTRTRAHTHARAQTHAHTLPVFRSAARLQTATLGCCSPAPRHC